MWKHCNLYNDNGYWLITTDNSPDFEFQWQYPQTTTSNKSTFVNVDMPPVTHNTNLNEWWEDFKAQVSGITPTPIKYTRQQLESMSDEELKQIKKNLK